MAFPATRHTLIDALRHEDGAVRERALDAVLQAYWRPVYKHVRLQWNVAAADAEDLTQGFFAQCLEKDWLARFDPARGRFRTFLRACVDAFVSKDRQAAQRLKRGGGLRAVPLDFAAAEAELQREPAAEADLDARFHREWVKSVFDLALQRLRAASDDAGRPARFAVFQRRHVDDAAAPSYATLAADLGLTVTQVTNELSAARREFRQHVLDVLRELTATEDEFRAEARQILGVDAE